MPAAGSDGAGMGARSLDFSAAPRELLDLRDALDAMSRRVAERSAALTSAIEDRDRLLRELHHRVKNTLATV